MDLLQTAPAAFLSFADDGTILLTNARLLQRLGYAPGELEGQHVETIFASGGRIFYHTHFFPLLKMQGHVEEIYLSLKTKSGDEIPVLANAIRTERNGQTVNDCVMMHIRQRRRFEDELLRARKAAEQASMAKARFLSMMSHDLRTPLMAITGFAEVLLRGMRGSINDDQREDLEAIKNAGQQMMKLMTDILSFAQLESGRVTVRLEAVRVAEAVERAETLMKLRFAEASLEYVRHACDADMAVIADAERLQQVILNLLSNAAKFTPAGGKVEVRCEHTDAQVMLHVSDTGIGIPEEKLNEIFEPFVQVAGESASRDGVGLGLSISRDLARAMRGDLTVASTVGRGSTFTITLPLAVNVARA